VPYCQKYTLTDCFLWRFFPHWVNLSSHLELLNLSFSLRVRLGDLLFLYKDYHPIDIRS